MGMQTSGGTPEPGSIAVAAIYDDLSDGLRAKEALARLRCSQVSFVPVSTFAWSFQQLERLDVRSHAFRVASSVDMIVIAAHAGCVLTGQINHWLERCLAARPPGLRILVALDAGMDASPASEWEDRGLRFSVRQFAARWGAKFMNNEEFEQQTDPASAAPWRGSQPMPPLLARQARGMNSSHIPRRFGIND